MTICAVIGSGPVGEYVANRIGDAVPEAQLIGLRGSRRWLKQIAPPGTPFVSAFPFGRCLMALKRLKASEVFFVGSPFDSLRPGLDMVTIPYLVKRRSFWFPHAYLYAIKDMLQDNFISLKSPLDFFPELEAEAGFAVGDCNGYDPSNDMKATANAVIQQPWKAIRQSYIVDQGKIVMAESGIINGTNRLIRKFGSSVNRKNSVFPVLCKITVPPFSKIDVPTIGVETARLCMANGIRAIVVEGGSTILMQREEVSALAGSGSICVYAL